MGCTRGDVGSVIPPHLPHPHASRPLLLGGGKLVSTRISRREYQSAPQASPSLVLSSSEETGLFHPMEAASSPLLCVCTRERVCVWICTLPLRARTLNKCQPVVLTDTPVQLPQIPAAAHVCLSHLLLLPLLLLLLLVATA